MTSMYLYRRPDESRTKKRILQMAEKDSWKGVILAVAKGIFTGEHCGQSTEYPYGWTEQTFLTS